MLRTNQDIILEKRLDNGTILRLTKEQMLSPIPFKTSKIELERTGRKDHTLLSSIFTDEQIEEFYDGIKSEKDFDAFKTKYPTLEKDVYQRLIMEAYFRNGIPFY
ncbi:hypothetical protein B6U80_00880 [Candidatus Pacearchaeota archaeon ex4484_26]|nr:MAG: hypothetical protein B6U80_00880 [Candidatus Pacearchaeota archaeon ex4484_26]